MQALRDLMLPHPSGRPAIGENVVSRLIRERHEEYAMRRIRTIVADDHPGMVSALVGALEGDSRFTVVATAVTGFEAERVARRTRPDVVILDMRMPGGGVVAARAITALPRPPVVVAVSAHSSPAAVADMLDAGAAGHLTKGRIGSLLPDLVVRCVDGEVVLV
jgi:DNA-binding NarL/FixJ family response regulator